MNADSALNNTNKIIYIVRDIKLIDDVDFQLFMKRLSEAENKIIIIKKTKCLCVSSFFPLFIQTYTNIKINSD